jgi:hypothetical protein
VPAHRKRRRTRRFGIGLVLLAAGLTASIAVLAMQASHMPQIVPSVAQLPGAAPTPAALRSVQPPITTVPTTPAPTAEAPMARPHPLATPMNVTPLGTAAAPEPFIATPAVLSPLSNWAQSVRLTALRSGPSDDTESFAELPVGAYVKILERSADWGLAVYAGDGNGRLPGTAWLRLSDLAPSAPAPRWVRAYIATQMWAGSGSTAILLDDMPQWSWFELLGTYQEDRLLVRTIGDGATHRSEQGWVPAQAVGPARTLDPAELPRAYPLTARPDALKIAVPYRTQLDGSTYAGANCGPTTLGMALGSVGVSVSSAELRREVLDAQQLWGDDVGAFIEALAQVAIDRGLRVIDLDAEGALKRWSVADIRRQIQNGHPVVAQVWYRALPGRADSLYDGDHYIVITGLVDDQLIYDDSIDSDGVGYDRIMTANQLVRAMNASDERYAFTAFAISRS